ncbi:MAG: C40 family peptidase [Spirochaetales bacterium]|nr:C40 family peptidase [Spirochaetales bacterium]
MKISKFIAATAFIMLVVTGGYAQNASKISDKKINGMDIVKEAVKYLGTPYVFGGNSLETGCDCSGFTTLIYKKFGITIPRTANAQYWTGKPIKESELKPGDIVAWTVCDEKGNKKSNVAYTGHVGIYIGAGLMINEWPGMSTNVYSYEAKYNDCCMIISMQGEPRRFFDNTYSGTDIEAFYEITFYYVNMLLDEGKQPYRMELRANKPYIYINFPKWSVFDLIENHPMTRQFALDEKFPAGYEDICRKCIDDYKKHGGKGYIKYENENDYNGIEVKNKSILDFVGKPAAAAVKDSAPKHSSESTPKPSSEKTLAPAKPHSSPKTKTESASEQSSSPAKPHSSPKTESASEQNSSPVQTVLTWNTDELGKNGSNQQWDISDKVAAGGAFTVSFKYGSGNGAVKLAKVLFSADGKGFYCVPGTRTLNPKKKTQSFSIKIPARVEKIIMKADMSASGSGKISGKITIVRGGYDDTGSSSGSNYAIGDRGPGGGLVFFAYNGSYMEIADKSIGKVNFADAKNLCRNCSNNSFSDWHLPTRQEAEAAVQNLAGLWTMQDAFWVDEIRYLSTSLEEITILKGPFSEAEINSKGLLVKGLTYTMQDRLTKKAQSQFESRWSDISTVPVRSFGNALPEGINLCGQPDKDAIKVGDRGPGGGTVYAVKSSKAWEISDVIETNCDWDTAVKNCKNYNGNGCKDWHLAAKTDLELAAAMLFSMTERMPGADCWSANELEDYPNFAYFVSMDYSAYSGNYNKSTPLAYRAIRSFPIGSKE